MQTFAHDFDYRSRTKASPVMAAKWLSPQRMWATFTVGLNSDFPKSVAGTLSGISDSARLGPFPRIPYPHTNTSPCSANKHLLCCLTAWQQPLFIPFLHQIQLCELQISSMRSETDSSFSRRDAHRWVRPPEFRRTPPASPYPLRSEEAAVESWSAKTWGETTDELTLTSYTKTQYWILSWIRRCY